MHQHFMMKSQFSGKFPISCNHIIIFQTLLLFQTSLLKGMLVRIVHLKKTETDMFGLAVQANHHTVQQNKDILLVIK